MTRDPKTATDRLDALVAVCDPVEGSPLTTAAIEEALDKIGAAIASRPQDRRKRSIRTVLLVGAAILVSGGAVATGAALTAHTGGHSFPGTAHTGQSPTKAEGKTGGPGEALDPDAPDYGLVARDPTGRPGSAVSVRRCPLPALAGREPTPFQPRAGRASGQ